MVGLVYLHLWLFSHPCDAARAGDEECRGSRWKEPVAISCPCGEVICHVGGSVAYKQECLELWYYCVLLCEHHLSIGCAMRQATIKWVYYFEYSSGHKQPEKWLLRSGVIKNSICVYGFCGPSNHFLRLRMPRNYFCSCAIEGNMSKGLRIAWPRCRTVGHLEVYYQSWNYYELIWKMV